MPSRPAASRSGCAKWISTNESPADVNRAWRPVLFFLIVLCAVYVGICAFMFFAQGSFVYFPQPRATLEGVDVVTLPVDGARVEISQRERPGADAILYFGGNAEDVAPVVPVLARLFPERSIHALHYRGYGGSTGTPVEAAIVRDALRVFDQLHEGHQRIAVIGRSLGSGVAVQVAAERPVERLVLVTPFASVRAIAQEQFPYLPMRVLLRNPFDSDLYAPGVKAPTRLIIAAQDQVISRSSSEALLAAFRPGIASIVVVAGDHNSNEAESAYRAALKD